MIPLDRLNIILDLDNTLINALEEPEREKIPLSFQDKFDYADMAAYGMRIFGRPGLQEFLDFLCTNFNVHVFTAAEQEYALFIINNFILTKPSRKVHHVFFRYHVDIALERYGGMKDLRLLWNIFNVPGMYPCNTLIVDDLKDVYEGNPMHTIRVASFDVANEDGVLIAESIQDRDLYRVMEKLLNLNDRYKNSGCVRQIINGYIPSITSPFLM
jgi:TFIIF-interacting CTD phosphatase-like protein